MSQKQPFHYAGMILLIATFYTYPYRNILCAPFVSVFNGLGNQTQGCGKPMTSFLLTMNFKMDDGMGNGYIHRNVQSNRLNDCQGAPKKLTSASNHYYHLQGVSVCILTHMFNLRFKHVSLYNRLSSECPCSLEQTIEPIDQVDLMGMILCECGNILRPNPETSCEKRREFNSHKRLGSSIFRNWFQLVLRKFPHSAKYPSHRLPILFVI